MFEGLCNVMRRNMPPQSPLVDGSATVRICLWKEFFIYAHANTTRVPIEMSSDEISVSDGRCHEEVRLASTFDEEANYFLPVTNHVLSWSRFVVDVEDINLRSMVDQKFRNLHRTGEMKWRLAVAPAGIYHLRVARQKFA